MGSDLATTWTANHGKLLLAVTMSPRDVGQRLQKAREMRGLTQVQMALELHVSPSSVARWEGGKLPPVRELMRVAEYLGIDPAALVETPDEQEQTDLEAIRRDARAAHREATRARAETRLISEKLDRLLEHFEGRPARGRERQEPPEPHADTL